MRKESIGRLLLSIMTVFVMVAGVFAAAVLNNAVTWEDGTSSDTIAPSELDNKEGGVGEAPTSANSRDNTEVIPSNLIEKTPDTSTQPLLPGEGSAKETPGSSQRSSTDTTAPEPRGTRIAPGAYVDAGGPYGTPADPLYEGDPTFFIANIYDDDIANYEFRWDIDDDGEYDTDWDSSPFYFHTFTDDHVGVARVQAFDGTSTTVTKTGIPLQEDTTMNDVRYWPGYATVTWAWEFETSQDIRITDLGFYRDGNIYGYLGSAPEYVYKMTIWDSSQNRILELSNPSGFPSVDYSWNWFSVSPYTLPQGTYRVSCNAYTSGSYENLFPGVGHPGTSPDGIVDMNARWVIWDDQYPYLWDGDWGLPALDFKYEYDEVTEVYLEDTAEVNVLNVAPIVSGATSVPSGAELPEGSPVEFTASFTDPGVADTWEFRYIWGDGEVSDWVSIPKYSFAEPVNNVLYYCDYDTGDYGRRALDDIGLSYTDVGSSESQLVSELESGTDWDLAVVQNPNYYWSSSTLDALDDYVQAGGKLIYETWLMGYNSGHDLWDSLGVYYGGNIYGTQTIYEWDTVHPIFNSPHELPSVLNPTNDYMGIDGHWIEPYWDTTPVCGYSPTYNPWWYETGIAARDNKQTIFHSFVAAHYQGDDDGDGVSDMLELFVNEIVWMLDGEAQQPWPDAMDLPPAFHVYKDDHPNTLTERDTFEVIVEVMDDDHQEEGYFPNLMSEDFEDSYPGLPDGWTQDGFNGWEGTYASSHPNYDGSGYAIWSPYWYYWSDGESSLYTTEMDATFSSNLVLDFDWYWYAYYYYGDQDGYVELSTDNGNTWITIWEIHSTYTPYSDLRAGHETIDVSALADGQNKLQLRFRMHQNFNYWWELDHVVLSGDVFIPGVPGLGSDSCEVTVFNVRPTTTRPAEFVDTVKENGVVNIGETDSWGFTIEDPALKEDTESFWYRIDYDDGTVTDWEPSGKPKPVIPGEPLTGGHLMVMVVPIDFAFYWGYSTDGAFQLMYNTFQWMMESDEGNILFAATGHYQWPGMIGTIEANTNSEWGTSYEWTYDSVGVDLLDPSGNLLYDVLFIAFNWDYLGMNYNLAVIEEYLDAGGNVVVTGDQFMYGDLDFLPYQVEFDGGYQGTPDFPGPAFSDDPLAVQLSDSVTTGSWGFYSPQQCTIGTYDDEEWVEIFADPSPITVLARQGAGGNYPKNLIIPETHVYGDNGKYAVDIQLIDDDMLWDLSGPQPVFTGTGDPMDWMTHNVFEVEVENTDPVISSIKAYVEFDMSLRVSGTKQHTATLQLYDDGVPMGAPLVVERDPGAPDFGAAPATLDLTKGHDYSIVVTVDPGDGGGGNPAWIYEMHFPDGKIKDFKHTFNDEHGWTWTITHSEIMQALLGHDIIFQATAADAGSDDLAFIWNFGDSTPHGIHLYANMYYTPIFTPLPVNGASAESVSLFTQLGTARDPYFEYSANDDRSPDMNPVMRLTDTITHVFDENQPYYYYVTLIVMDDDVEEPYESTELHPVSGIDVCYLELELI
jgi:hypothetical protein